MPSGQTLHLVLKGIFAPPKGGSPYGDITISTQRFDAEYQNPQNLYAFVDMEGGVTDANTAKLTDALKSFPDAKIATASEFKKNQEQGINMLLNLLYVLLSLSIVVSLFGIVNTLVLTVFERTRELGMLRAVGFRQRGIFSVFLLEYSYVALLGILIGTGLGILLIYNASTAAASGATGGLNLVFAPPWLDLAVVLLVAYGLMAAAVFVPSLKAARLPPAEALRYSE